MRTSVGRTVLLLTLVGAAAAHALEPPRPARPPRPPVPTEPGRAEVWATPRPGAAIGFGITGVESVLRQKDELKLTDQQVAQLEVIRKEEVARRQNESRDMIDLESRYQAGLIDRDSWRDEMETRSDTRTTAERSVRNRVEKILTDEQREQLEERRFRRAAFGERELIERLERDRWLPTPLRLPREPFFERLPDAPRMRIRRFDEWIRESPPQTGGFRWERRGIL